MRKTATVERYHCFGTSRHHLILKYRGDARVKVRGTAGKVVDIADFGDESLRLMRSLVKAYGFTHVKFTGDWTKRTKPRGGLV